MIIDDNNANTNKKHSENNINYINEKNSNNN